MDSLQPPTKQHAAPQKERLRALQEGILDPASTLELEEVLQRVVRMAQRMSGARHAHIFLYDPVRDELTLVARHSEPGRAVTPPPPRRAGVTFRVAHSGKPQFVPDALSDPGYAAFPTEVRPGALAVLPLLKGEKVLGTLNLGFRQPRRFDDETRDLLDLMAHHAAIAIDNALLYASARGRASELAALYDISLEIGGQLDLKKLLEDIVRRGKELLSAGGAYVFLFDADRQVLKLIAQVGMDEKYAGREIRLGEGMSGRVALERRALAVENYHAWQGRAETFEEIPLAATAAAPLLWQGQLLGTLGVHMREGDSRVFQPDEIRLVEQLAAQAAIAIQNARLYSEARQHEEEMARRLEELALVNEISHNVNQLDLDQVQESALDQVVARFGAAYAALGLFDPAAETVTITAVRPVADPLLGTVLRVEENPDLSQPLKLKQAIIWRDDPQLESDDPTRNYLRTRGTRQLVVAPLLVKDQAIGLLGLDPGTGPLSPSEISLIQTVANQVAIAMENARLAGVAIEKARIEGELQLARSVQSRYLGHAGPQLPGWDVSARWRPAREVSGDFYDFIPLPDGRLGIVMGDVTDKGMPAALVMATTRAVIRAVAWGADSPGRVLSRVNDLLCPDMPPNMFVTCFYGILDPASGRLRFANAGQDLPCYRGMDGPVKLHATGFPLGLMSQMPYEENEAVIAPGELVLFYSDGLVEAHNARREMFGYNRVASIVMEQSEGSVLIDRLLEQLAEFTGREVEQEDDVTLITLQRG